MKTYNEVTENSQFYSIIIHRVETWTFFSLLPQMEYQEARWKYMSQQSVQPCSMTCRCHANLL